jgi:hypothetical protein
VLTLYLQRSRDLEYTAMKPKGILTSTIEEGAEIIANHVIPQHFEVCITSYKICVIENQLSLRN